MRGRGNSAKNGGCCFPCAWSTPRRCATGSALMRIPGKIQGGRFANISYLTSVAGRIPIPTSRYSNASSATSRLRPEHDGLCSQAAAASEGLLLGGNHLPGDKDKHL